jgi:hypothetical protein
MYFNNSLCDELAMDDPLYQKLYTGVPKMAYTNGALRCRRDYRKLQKNVKKNSIGLILLISRSLKGQIISKYVYVLNCHDS